MNDSPTLKEVKASIRKMSMAKAAGKDDFFAEILQYVCDQLADIMNRILLNF